MRKLKPLNTSAAVMPLLSGASKRSTRLLRIRYKDVAAAVQLDAERKVQSIRRRLPGIVAGTLAHRAEQTAEEVALYGTPQELDGLDLKVLCAAVINRCPYAPAWST